MATRTKQAATDKAPIAGKVAVKFADTDADPVESAAVAKFVLRPSVNAAVLVKDYGKTFGDLDLAALVGTVDEGINVVNAGDMSRVEGMLYAQAQALQTMFMNFSRRSLAQEYQATLESYFRMAMKAQNQCRMTLETLATIKNPPVVIARQANINNGGQQQVNNGAPAATDPSSSASRGCAHAADSESPRTELLEAENGERMDPRTAGAASRADPHLVPVGSVDRAEDG
jgi:hypothetical protein